MTDASNFKDINQILPSENVTAAVYIGTTLWVGDKSGNIWINDKTDFLVSRDNYSYQLKNYFTNIGQEHRTCVISFALKRKDIEKKYKKMKEKYVKAGNFSIKTLGKNDFQFTTIKPDDYELENFK